MECEGYVSFIARTFPPPTGNRDPLSVIRFYHFQKVLVDPVALDLTSQL